LVFVLATQTSECFFQNGGHVMLIDGDRLEHVNTKYIATWKASVYININFYS